MKPKTKRILASLMLIGDLFMMLVGIVLMADGDVGLGLTVMGIIGIDTAITIDYIMEQNRKIKLDADLQKENAYEDYIQRQMKKVNPIKPRGYSRKAPAMQPINEEEAELMDMLNQNNNQNQQMHG